MLRERAGASEVTVELPEGARVRDAVAALGGLADGLPLVMAVNREYAPDDALLDPGDELALLPPASGGGVPGRGAAAGGGGQPRVRARRRAARPRRRAGADPTGQRR